MELLESLKKMLCGFTRGKSVFMLKGAVKMRPVLKSAHPANFINTSISSFQQIPAVFKAFFLQPFTRCCLENTFKLLFKGRQASGT